MGINHYAINEKVSKTRELLLKSYTRNKDIIIIARKYVNFNAGGAASLTNAHGCDMMSVDKNDQKVRPKAGGKGNQVEVLNDPVTVSGSDIL